jgi:hypothetical protein
MEFSYAFLLLYGLCPSVANQPRVGTGSVWIFPDLPSGLCHHRVMTTTVKMILVAVVSFVLGHISCALMHHFHHHMHNVAR